MVCAKSKKLLSQIAKEKWNRCDFAGARTQDPIIKSDVLYQLSYKVNAHSLTNEHALHIGFFQLRCKGTAFFLNCNTLVCFF